MSQQTPTFTTGQFVGASSSNDSVLGSTMPYQPVCQRCFNPLQLDQDFEHLQKTELLTLIGETFCFFCVMYIICFVCSQ